MTGTLSVLLALLSPTVGAQDPAGDDVELALRFVRWVSTAAHRDATALLCRDEQQALSEHAFDARLASVSSADSGPSFQVLSASRVRAGEDLSLVEVQLGPVAGAPGLLHSGAWLDLFSPLPPVSDPTLPRFDQARTRETRRSTRSRSAWRQTHR